ncbi:hypothetical protein K3556_05980 [Aliiroseovarius sp. M344]|nr:hypothetical protein [Aliiroseovarius sp. M344]UWQ15434.1 hypothetical protein K3556_05980 [Aliiroseovarius sp. M344]
MCFGIAGMRWGHGVVVFTSTVKAGTALFLYVEVMLLVFSSMPITPEA